MLETLYVAFSDEILEMLTRDSLVSLNHPQASMFVAVGDKKVTVITYAFGCALS